MKTLEYNSRLGKQSKPRRKRILQKREEALNSLSKFERVRMQISNDLKQMGL